MSKIGKLPVLIPENVTLDLGSRKVEVAGPKGKLSIVIDELLEIVKNDNYLSVSLKKDSKKGRAIWGTTRKLIANMVKGVTEGWVKKLEIVGTGYRAELQGTSLILTVGYSHTIKIDAPQDVTFKIDKNIISVDGIDRAVVGQVAADIRAVRPPEPYKGKGIKYVDEVIRRKAGKAAKAAA